MQRYRFLEEPARRRNGYAYEISERYVRDFFHPSHDQTPFYKGIPSDYVRDEGIYASLVKSEK